MSRKSERRARRQAINELLAHQEPPSRLDRLDHNINPRQKTQSETLTHATDVEQRPQVPQQAGPSRSETAAPATARHT